MRVRVSCGPAQGHHPARPRLLLPVWKVRVPDPMPLPQMQRLDDRRPASEGECPVIKKESIFPPKIWPLLRDEVLREQAKKDVEPRPLGCKCHLEAGDSPCPVHGDADS